MDHAIASVRDFNRFYTQLVGALDPRFLGSPLPLVEARMLFEIARVARPLAADLQAALDLDAGYVSRILRKFETDGLIVRERGEGDARKRPIVLTAAGRAAFEAIDARQREKVEAMLQPLGVIERRDLLAALTTTRALLGSPSPAYAIRPFRTGDMGSIAARQSTLYAEAFGWGRPLEIIVGDVVTAFLRGFKPGRDQCWIAEIDGVMAGSIFATDEGDGVARLRLLYVEPFARGLGIGDRLVATCVAFAREVGYRSMILWTHTILSSARRIYAAHGFRLVETKVHEAFGTPVQGETWRLELGDVPSDLDG